MNNAISILIEIDKLLDRLSVKGEDVFVLSDARKGGFARVRIDGIMYDLSEEINLDKNQKNNT